MLVDDHEIVRRGLRELLESEPDLHVVAEASTITEAEAFDPRSIDVAVLDVRLPDGSGIDLCRNMRATRPDLPCVMLTAFADDEALAAAVLAGAKGYVIKTVNGNQLADSLRRAAAGENLLRADQVKRARDNLQRQAAEEARLGSLSPQEKRILELLAEGLSNREIAQTMYLAEKTVKNYVSNLLAKLGFSRRTEAALFAQRQHDLHHPSPT